MTHKRGVGVCLLDDGLAAEKGTHTPLRVAKVQETRCLLSFEPTRNSFIIFLFFFSLPDLVNLFTRLLSFAAGPVVNLVPYDKLCCILDSTTAPLLPPRSLALFRLFRFHFTLPPIFKRGSWERGVYLGSRVFKTYPSP